MLDILKIGMYGHLLMFGLVTYYFFYMKSALWGYWIGSAVNEMVVVILKRILKQPRPAPISLDKEAHDYYGMPSGHTQHTIFSIVYVALMNPNVIWLLCLSLLSGVSMYERVHNNKHTIWQIIVGGMLGIMMAGITYKLTKMYYESEHNKLVLATEESDGTTRENMVVSLQL